MKKLMVSLILAPLAVSHASTSPSDSLIHCRVRHDVAPLGIHAAGKRLADLNLGEPRTVRLFYFLPNDRTYRLAVVQRMKDEILRIQDLYGKQMEAHGYGYRTFRIETDDFGDPLVHRVDGQHPDIHYLSGTWALRDEIAEVFDLSGNIHVFVIDNSTSRIDIVNAGEAAYWSKQSGAALVGGEFRWSTIAHELGHAFGLDHDFRDDSYMMSYGGGRNSLSACSAEFLAVHPYFDPDVAVEEAEGPAIEVLSPPGYPEGSESVPIQLKVSDPDGLQQVRLIVRTRATHSISAGGVELKACRGLMGAKEATEEIGYDGVIPSGRDYGFSDLSNPRVHPIEVEAVDREGNIGKWWFQLWQVSRQHLATLEVAGEVPSLAFAPDGATLATGSRQGVRLWNLETRTATEALSGGLTVLAYSHDGATLAIGSGSQVQLWDMASGAQVATLPGHTQQVRSLDFTRDGRTLASGAPDAIRLWDVETQTGAGTLPVGASSVAFSPDGATLASGSDDGVRLWDVEMQTEIATHRHSDDRRPGVNTVAFSPDGILVASGGDDATVRLWDVAADENAAVLEGHDRPVRSVSFSADGTLLASGADLVVNLWDPGTGERLVSLQG